MQVILAGYNIDEDLLAQLRQPGTPGPSPIDPAAVTPETLSAAYARISRDPRPIPELREEARRDVARARRSNRRIVFEFGHHSVAEHAVFNLDILGISRLAVEALEATRLGSYTEKSQRYILLGEDVIVPAEIRGSPLEADFRGLLELQQRGYRDAHDTLIAHYRDISPEAWENRRERSLLEGAAKEDARYFLGLATTGQVGTTLNARSLEATVRRLGAHPLEEVRELGRRLHEAVVDIAPSLLLFTDPPPYRQNTPRELVELVRSMHATDGAPTAAHHAGNSLVRLLQVTPQAEDQLLAALVHSHSNLSWESSTALVAQLSDEQRRALVTTSLRRHSLHDVPLRAFELPTYSYELIVSASCYAQLKRHRMATLLAQDYDPQLGVTVPEVFGKLGLVSHFAEVQERSEEICARIRKLTASDAAAGAPDAPLPPEVATYALTNAHRRRVLFRVNARELYHFARLRMDAHAQWDIRALAVEMIRQARARTPLTMLLAGGKDGFDKLRSAALGDA